MAGVPIAAASGVNAIVGALRFNPVPDEDMLPEARKDIADNWWETIVACGVDCIFDNMLPAHEDYSYSDVPLTPVLVQPATTASGTATYTQSQIDRSVNDRNAIEHSNTKKAEVKARMLITYKSVLAVALLKAFKQNAPLFESQMRKDHVLVAATVTMPAKHDGCAIFKAFRDATNHIVASRQVVRFQVAEAEAHKKRLEIRMPNNCTSSQFAQLINTFLTDIVP